MKDKLKVINFIQKILQHIIKVLSSLIEASRKIFSKFIAENFF